MAVARLSAVRMAVLLVLVLVLRLLRLRLLLLQLLVLQLMLLQLLLLCLRRGPSVTMTMTRLAAVRMAVMHNDRRARRHTNCWAAAAVSLLCPLLLRAQEAVDGVD